MITDTVKRTTDDVKREYASLCQEVGDAYVMKTELELAINERFNKMQVLKKEHLELEKLSEAPIIDEAAGFRVNGI